MQSTRTAKPTLTQAFLNHFEVTKNEANISVGCIYPLILNKLGHVLVSNQLRVSVDRDKMLSYNVRYMIFLFIYFQSFILIFHFFIHSFIRPLTHSLIYQLDCSSECIFFVLISKSEVERHIFKRVLQISTTHQIFYYTLRFLVSIPKLSFVCTRFFIPYADGG